MSKTNAAKVAGELGLALQQVEATSALLDEGATVPFIARYRKERTGSLDEEQIRAVRDRLSQLAELDSRRAAIIKSLTERELLTPELEQKVNAAETMAVLEDVYLPFRPKRRTRATIAKERGLEPLALMILAQDDGTDPLAQAAAFVDAEKEVPEVEAALAGARDIIAEIINEDQDARASMRDLYEVKGVIQSKVMTGKEEAGQKFRDYFEWSEPLAQAPSHRVLAVRRGEKEEMLSLRISPPEEDAMALLSGRFVTGQGPCSEQVSLAVSDSYKRLLGPSMETEVRLSSKKRADEEAIKVFAENVRTLMMSPPLGQKAVLAIDPGFRTGCKVVCLDQQGNILANDVINIMTDKQRADALDKVQKLIAEHGIEAIAIGNGTASRETESLFRGVDLPGGIPVVLVNESGASVYSASKLARQEFPDLDVSVRGAISIGRRLMDPLAELVKIDPKSIGVGQYQHDVDQKSLKEGLEDVVISCVNAVGVELNTASAQLLSYVSGLGPSLAQGIVEHRAQNGPFASRQAILDVPRLGPKAFEQAAGFLRVRDSENPLDSSAVHPESYPIVEAMAGDLDCTVADLIKQAELRRKIELGRYANDEVGLPTLQDIIAELEKPGRDPREGFEAFAFAEGVEKLEDLEPGMKLPGIVTNVTNFGAFVDVGVHQDGLVHISELSDDFISDPRQAVKVQQQVIVTVMEVDVERRRISLSMRPAPGAPRRRPGSKPQDHAGGDRRPPRSDRKTKGKGKGRPKAAQPEASQKDKDKKQDKPFNNPFAAALGDLKLD